MNRRLPILGFVVVLLASCNGSSSDLSVVSKEIRSEANVSAAVPSEFAGAATSTGKLYWVEGKVKNAGTSDVVRVTITFRCTDGNTRRLFVAEVPKIPAGATVAFTTDKYPSPLVMQFVDQRPEISVGK